MSQHLDPELREALETIFVLTYERERDIAATLDTVVRFLDGARKSRVGLLTATAIGVSSIKRRRRATASMAKLRIARTLGPEIARVAHHHRLEAEDLTGDSLVPEVVAARYEAYWRLRQLRHSLPIVGLAVGGRNHSTVHTGLRKFEAMLAADPALRARIEQIAVAEAGARREASEAAPQAGERGHMKGPSQFLPPTGSQPGDSSASPAKLSLRAA